jgi:hypothetical protein
MKYKSFNEPFHVHGYTLKTKYKHLAIFTNFFFPHFWLLKSSKITSFFVFKFQISHFDKVLLVEKRLVCIVGVFDVSFAQCRDETTGLHIGVRLLLVSIKF